MHLKKFLLFGLMAAVLPAVAEEAADRKTATSLKYVEHELSTRQNKFTAEANKAMEYTNTAGDVQKRTVKSDLGSDTTDTSLPMVGGVNTKLNQKQDDIDPINDHTAVTYTGQSGSIGAKGIYQATESYAAQSDNLIDAKTFNAALKNGLDSEFKCREDNRDPGTDLCWLWEIHNNVGNESQDGYTLLEYIQTDTTGYQHINTGISVNAGDVAVTAVFAPTSLTPRSGAYSSIFGRNGYFQAGYTVTGQANIGNATSTETFFALNTKATVSGILSPSQPQKLFVNGIDTGLSRTFETNQFLYLLGSDPSAYIATGQLYSFTATRNGSEIMHLIPAKHGNVVGMYDTVSGQFFENAGTGSFIAGPELNVYIPQNQ